MRKKITLEPEFPKPKISLEEKVYNSLKTGPKTQKAISEDINVPSGGSLYSSTQKLVLGGFINKRKCECGMHDIYEIIK